MLLKNSWNHFKNSYWKLQEDISLPIYIAACHTNMYQLLVSLYDVNDDDAHTLYIIKQNKTEKVSIPSIILPIVCLQVYTY